MYPIIQKSYVVLVFYISILKMNSYVEQKKMYNFFEKIILLFCCLSVVSYIMLLLGISLEPDQKLVLPNKEQYGFYYFKYNFLIILVKNNILLNRFNSIFDEPGQLGTILGLLIVFENKGSKLKKALLYFFGALTTSFAFYMFVGLKLLFSFDLKKFIKIIFLIILTMKFIPDPIKYQFEERVYNKVVNLNFNREDEEARKILQNLKGSKNFFWGSNKNLNEEFDFDISSYKIIVYEKGVVRLFLLIIFLLYISDFLKYSLRIKLSILILLLSIYQRPLILTPLYMNFLILGPINLLEEKSERKNFIIR